MKLGVLLRFQALTLAPSSSLQGQEEAKLLDQVVDSFPHFIGRIWGYEEHQPYSVVLNDRLLGQQVLHGPEGRAGIRTDRAGTVSSPDSWLGFSRDRADGNTTATR